MNTLKEKLQLDRMVSVSIEPGGLTKHGSIGLSEIVGDEVRNSFYMSFMSPLGDRIPQSQEEIAQIAEAPEEKVPPFAEVWQYADAFVGDSVVTTYGQNPDINTLRRLALVSEMEMPDYYLIDGKTALMNHLQRRPGSLQEVALTHVLDSFEIEQRKELAYAGAQQTSNWLLHNAAHKADVAAKVFTKVIYPAREITLPQVLSVLSMKAYSLRSGKYVDQ